MDPPSDVIYNNGECIEHWAIDTDSSGDIISNGGTEGLYLFNGDYYLIRWDAKGPFGTPTKIDPEHLSADDMIWKAMIAHNKDHALSKKKQIAPYAFVHDAGVFLPRWFIEFNDRTVYFDEDCDFDTLDAIATAFGCEVGEYDDEMPLQESESDTAGDHFLSRMRGQ